MPLDTPRAPLGTRVRGMSAKSRIAWHLRCLADRIDPSTGPRAFGGYWNHTPHGLVVTLTDGIQTKVPGCRLWYMAEDYRHAWKGMP